MRKVITYGTFDLLHEGHLRLLQRARELGDYLVVGVTSADFDRHRGKIDVQQSLAERMEAVRESGYADEVIPEEYEGQKIDDICQMGIDVFTVGSDWRGHFDYLEDFCEVVYLDRTEGISSTQIRTEANRLRLGVIGVTPETAKFMAEAENVSGVKISGAVARGADDGAPDLQGLLDGSDAVYVAGPAQTHYEDARACLLADKHVLCELPVGFSAEQAQELYDLAEERGLVLFGAVKTAYALAFSRMLLLVKSDFIGTVRQVRASCTSLAPKEGRRSSFTGWGPTALLPILGALGTHWQDARIAASFDRADGADSFAQLDLRYDGAVATAVVGNGVKTEGDLVISGTKGYIYVPSPWWKTDYFEVRFEDFSRNRRYFYQLEGEGIPFEVEAFMRAVKSGRGASNVPRESSVAIAALMGGFADRTVPVLSLQ